MVSPGFKDFPSSNYLSFVWKVKGVLIEKFTKKKGPLHRPHLAVKKRPEILLWSRIYHP